MTAHYFHSAVCRLPSLEPINYFKAQLFSAVNSSCLFDCLQNDSRFHHSSILTIDNPMSTCQVCPSFFGILELVS